MREKNFTNMITIKQKENFNQHIKACLKGDILTDYYFLETYS